MSIYIGNKQVAGSGKGISFAEEDGTITGRLPIGVNASDSSLYLSDVLYIEDNSSPAGMPNTSIIKFNDAGNINSAIRFGNSYSIGLNPCIYEDFKWYTFSQYGIHLTTNPDVSYENGAIDLLIPADFHAPGIRNVNNLSVHSGKLLGNTTYYVSNSLSSDLTLDLNSSNFLPGETVVIYIPASNLAKLKFTNSATNGTVYYAANFKEAADTTSYGTPVDLCYAIHRINQTRIIVNVQVYAYSANPYA